MTLDRVLGYMSDTVGTIDSYEEYRAKHYDTGVLEQIDIDRFDDGFDLDQDDTESMDPDEFATKGKTRFLLSDVDWRTWRDCILRDMDVIHRLLDMVAGIDAHTTRSCSVCTGPSATSRTSPSTPATTRFLSSPHSQTPPTTCTSTSTNTPSCWVEYRGSDRHESGTMHG